jgi:hypothetical protein
VAGKLTRHGASVGGNRRAGAGDGGDAGAASRGGAAA